MNNLKEIIKGKNGILLLGAGVSIATSANSLSSWKGLLKNGIETCKNHSFGDLDEEWVKRRIEDVEKGDVTDLISNASQITERLKNTGIDTFKRWVENTIGRLPIKNRDLIETFQYADLPILTTNYDTLIEQVLQIEAVTWKTPEECSKIIKKQKKGVLHLHGCWRAPDSMVFDLNSYQKIVSDNFIQTILRSIEYNRSIIFIGFGGGMSDPNFKGFINWAKDEFRNSQTEHYILISERDSTVGLPDNIKPIIYGKEYADLPEYLRSLFEQNEGNKKKDEPTENRTEEKLEIKSEYKLLPLPSLNVTAQVDKNFVGRKRPLRDLYDALSGLINMEQQVNYYSSQVQLIWVSGLGGIGKSWFLLKAVFEAQKSSEIKVGFIDFHREEWSRPYREPKTVVQLCEVIAQRIGKLYGIEFINGYIKKLDEIKKYSSEHNRYRSAFTRSFEAFRQRLEAGNLSKETQGDSTTGEDYIKSRNELEEDLAILYSIFQEEDLHQDKRKQLLLIKDINTDLHLYENYFCTWAERKLGAQSSSDPRINPNSVLVDELRICISNACEKAPLLLVLDTCEVLKEMQDKYLRSLVCPLINDNKSLLVLIANRFKPDRFKKYRYVRAEGWKQQIDDYKLRLIDFDNEPLTYDDISYMLEKLNREHPINNELVANLYAISKGIPFVLHFIFDLHEKGDDILWVLDNKYGSTYENLSTEASLKRIVTELSERWLVHIKNNFEELEDVILLSILQKFDNAIIKEYWCNEDVNAKILQLTMKHSFITNGDLHEIARDYFRKYWRSNPDEPLVNKTISKLEEILEEKRIPVSLDSPAYYNWYTAFLNLKSWHHGSKILIDIFKGIMMGLIIDESVQALIDLAEELKADKLIEKKIKAFLEKSTFLNIYSVGLSELDYIFLENINSGDWHPCERACLYLFIAYNYSQIGENAKGVNYFEKAFSLLDNYLPQTDVLGKAYLNSIFQLTIDKEDKQVIDTSLGWISKFNLSGFGLYEELGKVLHNAGKYKESNEICWKGLSEEPENVQIYTCLVHNLGYHLNNHSEVITVLQNAPASVQKDYHLLWLQGYSFEALKKYKSAEECYKKAISSNIFGRSKIKLSLAELYANKLHKKQLAKENFQEAIRFAYGEEKINAITSYLIFLINGKEDEEFHTNLMVFDDLIERYRSDASILNDIAWKLYINNVRLDLAEKYAKEGYSNDASFSYVLQTLAAILVREQKWDEARIFIDKWLDLIDNKRIESAWKDDVLMFQDIVKQNRQEEMEVLLTKKGDGETWLCIRWALLKTLKKENNLPIPDSLKNKAEKIYKQLLDNENDVSFPS